MGVFFQFVYDLLQAQAVSRIGPVDKKKPGYELCGQDMVPLGNTFRLGLN